MKQKNSFNFKKVVPPRPQLLLKEGISIHRHPPFPLMGFLLLSERGWFAF